MCARGAERRADPRVPMAVTTYVARTMVNGSAAVMELRSADLAAGASFWKPTTWARSTWSRRLELRLGAPRRAVARGAGAGGAVGTALRGRQCAAGRKRLRAAVRAVRAGVSGRRRRSTELLAHLLAHNEQINATQ